MAILHAGPAGLDPTLAPWALRARAACGDRTHSRSRSMSMLGGGGAPSVTQLCQELRTLRSGRHSVTGKDPVPNFLKHSVATPTEGTPHVTVQGDFVTCTRKCAAQQPGYTARPPCSLALCTFLSCACFPPARAFPPANDVFFERRPRQSDHMATSASDTSRRLWSNTTRSTAPS